MKVLLNSNLLPIISVAMYNSSISSENLFDDYSIDSLNKDGLITDNQANKYCIPSRLIK